MKPIITIDCISNNYPVIKGDCEVGVLNVYNSEFKLVKSINVTKSFFINLDDVPSNAYVLTNVVAGIESEFSSIITKCKCINDKYNKSCGDNSLHC